MKVEKISTHDSTIHDYEGHERHDFVWAFSHIKDGGAKMRLPEWEEDNSYLALAMYQGKPCIARFNINDGDTCGIFYHVTDDLFREDWEACEIVSE